MFTDQTVSAFLLNRWLRTQWRIPQKVMVIDETVSFGAKEGQAAALTGDATAAGADPGVVRTIALSRIRR